MSVRAGVTWLGGHALPIASLAGTLRLSSRVELGGQGVFTIRPVRISPPDSPDRPELSTGYGGLLVRWKPAGSAPGLRWGGSLHVGAGTARIRSPLADAELASENFFFFEPAIHVLFRQDHTVRGSLDAGYRVTLGARAVPWLPGSKFRGPSVGVGLQIVRDP
jgi:hypothetical protein